MNEARLAVFANRPKGAFFSRSRVATEDSEGRARHREGSERERAARDETPKPTPTVFFPPEDLFLVEETPAGRESRLSPREETVRIDGSSLGKSRGAQPGARTSGSSLARSVSIGGYPESITLWGCPPSREHADIKNRTASNFSWLGKDHDA
jgi:hypothetical protein